MTNRVYKEQIVYFFREGTGFKSFELSMALYNNLKHVFKNSQPTVVPIPDDAPADVPRGVWNDYNTKMSFNLQSLNLNIDIPTTHEWFSLTQELSKLIENAISQCNLLIDRVGIVIEANWETNLQMLMKDMINIPGFVCDSEAHLSWLDHDGSYNVWTHLIIDVPHDVNKIIFDVNNMAEYKLSEHGNSVINAIDNALLILKGRIESGV